ncbi:hypothetical protein AC249_AIPGENE5607 [Exaiptasia diaphana]|nr:hypothetical protein AC249_AIPGENE5607 [Exaiptasia diaphana]
MSLIQQIQQLGHPAQARIMHDLHAKYPNSIELTTAYTQLIEWIQNQPWVGIQWDCSNAQHCAQAKSLIEEISDQLQPADSHMNFQGVVTARTLLSKYETDPISLVMALQEINSYMISLVQSFVIQEEDDTMEEDEEENSVDDIKKELKDAGEESMVCGLVYFIIV